MTRLGLILLLLVGILGKDVSAIQIVSESPNSSCEELVLAKDLKIYKDPALFLANFGLINIDPDAGWENLTNENPLLTTLRGKVQLMRLGAPREFKNFGAVSKIYESVEPGLRQKDRKGRSIFGSREKTLIIPIKICGAADAYTDTLGFVLEAHLQKALIDDRSDGASLPPSTLGNPIPELKP